MKFIALFLILSGTANAACEIQRKDVKVNWTAFKTPKKVGVTGSFLSLGLPDKKSAGTIRELMSNQSFSIDTTSVFTDNKDRDQKIVKSFFSILPHTKIEGKILSMDRGTITLEITMNKVTKKIPLVFTDENNTITAKGFIDILDFKMQKSLTGINNACLELHEGKTWSDVAIELIAPYKC